MKEVSIATGAADQPVLLLHCSASSGRQWDRLAGMLGDGLCPIAPDLYGYGSAPSWTGPGALNLAAETGLAAAALPDDADALHIVGHSYGGAVALRLAVEQPWRVRSLTLVEPVAFHVLGEGVAADRRILDSVRRLAGAMVEGIRSGDYHQAMGLFVDYWNGDGAWQRMQPETQRRLSRHAPKVVLDFHAAIHEPTTLDTYRRRFDFPVLVLRGARSPQSARRVAAMLAKQIPGASLVNVAGAGHMLPLTHPEPVNTAIVAHITDSPSTRRRRAA